MEEYRISNKDIEEFSPDLREILFNELAAKNEIFETWKGWPYNGIVICLWYPFKTKTQFQSDKIVFREVNDIHYWKSEYHDLISGDMLVCKFGL